MISGEAFFPFFITRSMFCKLPSSSAVLRFLRSQQETCCSELLDGQFVCRVLQAILLRACAIECMVKRLLTAIDVLE